MTPDDPEAARLFCRNLMAGADGPPAGPGRATEAGVRRLAVAAIAMAHRRAGLCADCPGVRLADGLVAPPCAACPAARAAERSAPRDA
ncbi:MAG: hypothetical protein AAF676_15025 [Pseudomonadota bacterium]